MELPDNTKIVKISSTSHNSSDNLVLKPNGTFLQLLTGKAPATELAESSNEMQDAQACKERKSQTLDSYTFGRIKILAWKLYSAQNPITH